MDFDAMRAAYLRALEAFRAAFPVVEHKPAPVVTPEAASLLLRAFAGRPSWGSE